MVRTEGDIAYVQMQRQEECASCGMNKLCHPSGGDAPIIEANNEVHASAGDIVVLETAASTRLGASFAVFIVPVVLMVIGAVWGQNLDPAWHEGVIVGALAGLAGGMLIAGIINRFARGKRGMRPYATRIVYSSPKPMQS